MGSTKRPLPETERKQSTLKETTTVLNVTVHGLLGWEFLEQPGTPNPYPNTKWEPPACSADAVTRTLGSVLSESDP